MGCVFSFRKAVAVGLGQGGSQESSANGGSPQVLQRKASAGRHLGGSSTRFNSFSKTF